MQVLTLFCQSPASAECLPSKKVLKLVEELAGLQRALKAFMYLDASKGAHALRTQLNKEAMDISVLYFAVELWANPEVGMQVNEELKKSPPTSNGEKLLFSLLKSLNKEESISFWSSLGEAPPRGSTLAPRTRIAPKKKLPTPAPPARPFPREAPSLRVVR